MGIFRRKEEKPYVKMTPRERSEWNKQRDFQVKRLKPDEDKGIGKIFPRYWRYETFGRRPGEDFSWSDPIKKRKSYPKGMIGNILFFFWRMEEYFTWIISYWLIAWVFQYSLPIVVLGSFLWISFEQDSGNWWLQILTFLDNIVSGFSTKSINEILIESRQNTGEYFQTYGYTPKAFLQIFDVLPWITPSNMLLMTFKQVSIKFLTIYGAMVNFTWIGYLFPAVINPYRWPWYIFTELVYPILVPFDRFCPRIGSFRTGAIILNVAIQMLITVANRIDDYLWIQILWHPKLW